MPAQRRSLYANTRREPPDPQRSDHQHGRPHTAVL